MQQTIKKIPQPVSKQKPEDPIHAALKARRIQQLEVEARQFEMWAAWINKRIDIACLNGDRWVGTLKAVYQYELLVEVEGSYDVILFKHAVSSVSPEK